VTVGEDDRADGTAAIRAAVSVFYDRVLDDPQLAGWFEGVDMRRLRKHQTAFLLYALGGAETYSGRPLRNAHTGLQITDAAFDATVEHLLAAFREVDIAPDVIAQLRGRVERTRSQIVGA
jgi:hemoglobin